MLDFTWPQKLLIWLIPLVFAVTVHEVAHGWVANWRGDGTAKFLGRLSLNPTKHIDPLGTIVIPLVLLFLSGGRFTFGYAKPVPVDPRNLKNPHWDMALVAIAGPLANLIMALGWAILARIGVSVMDAHQWIGEIFIALGLSGIQINLVLGVLNLIPIPPLDGSRVLSAFLSPPAALQYNRIERYGFIILIALLASGILGKVLWPIISTLLIILLNLVGISLH